MLTDWLMLGVTIIYVIATVFIWRANASSVLMIEKQILLSTQLQLFDKRMEAIKNLDNPEAFKYYDESLSVLFGDICYDKWKKDKVQIDERKLLIEELLGSMWLLDEARYNRFALSSDQWNTNRDSIESIIGCFTVLFKGEEKNLPDLLDLEPDFRVTIDKIRSLTVAIDISVRELKDAMKKMTRIQQDLDKKAY